MIVYTLICDLNHTFEAWFKDSNTYEEQHDNKELICPLCSGNVVQKAIMAPSLVSLSGTFKKVNNDLEATAKKIDEFKERLQKDYKYVGKDFTNKALDMKSGKIKKDNIYGEATIEEFKELIEAEVDVLPLPFTPSKKAN